MHPEHGLRDEARALAPDLIALRRWLHQHPEIGLELPASQQAVIEALGGLDVEISVGKSLTSVTAVLRGAARGPAVLLRGDMDALPVAEISDADYRSQVDGVMHACGHDLHTTMLVGAARLLAAHRDQLRGDVVFMFQPGEEGWDGASHMLREGVLEASGHRVSSAYAMHVMASMPSGTFACRPGTLMAASATLDVTVRGLGGHGSMPHHAKDPISVAAQIVGDLQTLVTRRFDVFDPVVVTVGRFQAGTARNIIPDEAAFEATIRAFSTEAMSRAETEIVRLCHSVAAAYDLAVDCDFRRQYPPTVNCPDHTQFVEAMVKETFGADRYQPLRAPRAGSEDFSRVLAEVPGCYVLLGARPGDVTGPAPENHSPRARFDEAVLADGALLHALLAIAALRRDAARCST